MASSDLQQRSPIEVVDQKSKSFAAQQDALNLQMDSMPIREPRSVHKRDTSTNVVMMRRRQMINDSEAQKRSNT